jgi:hypothetical protein
MKESGVKATNSLDTQCHGACSRRPSSVVESAVLNFNQELVVIHQLGFARRVQAHQLWVTAVRVRSGVTIKTRSYSRNSPMAD